MKTALILTLAAALVLPACASKSPTPADERDSILKMRDETLAELYKTKPETKDKIAKAPGYAVFSTYGLTVIFVGGAGGKGVAVNNQTKAETFMEEGSASVGIGLGGHGSAHRLHLQRPRGARQLHQQGLGVWGGGHVTGADGH